MLNTNQYPSISVVIPSYNQGQFIEETLLSVIGQQYPNLEILVIDGGSTDNTIEILETYSDKLSYWHSKKDQGQGDAINQGMNLSSGEIVCWLNSDDVYLPGTLLDIGRRFQGKVDRHHLIYGATIFMKQINGQLTALHQETHEFDPSLLTYFDFIPQPSSFWTRSLWQATGELDRRYNYVLDWDWFIRASKLAAFEFVPRFYSLYRCHSLHKTATGGDERRQEIFNIVQRYASNYWVSVYSEVGEHYDQIQERLQLLSRLRIPKRHLLLPLLFPNLRRQLKDARHVITAMVMYA